MGKLKFFTAAILLCTSTAILAQGLGEPMPPGPPPPPPPPRAPEKEYASSQEQYAALLKAANGGTKLRPDSVPDWSGVWTRDGRNFMSPGAAQLAKLTPRYQKAFDQKMASVKAGKEWDRLSDCLPTGFPRFLAEPWLREFIVTPNETWMTHEQINETRRIYTDGRGHVPDDKAVPLWMGDSVGFWDKDTLVIHTTQMKGGEYQRRQPDFSFHISTVERVRLVDPKTIEDVITIYDPDSLLKPWTQVFVFKKTTGDIRVNYAACEENNNTFRNPDGTSNERIPGDPGFKDATKFGIPEVAYDSIPQ